MEKTILEMRLTSFIDALKNSLRLDAEEVGKPFADGKTYTVSTGVKKLQLLYLCEKYPEAVMNSRVLKDELLYKLYAPEDRVPMGDRVRDAIYHEFKALEPGALHRFDTCSHDMFIITVEEMLDPGTYPEAFNSTVRAIFWNNSFNQRISLRSKYNYVVEIAKADTKQLGQELTRNYQVLLFLQNSEERDLDFEMIARKEIKNLEDRIQEVKRLRREL